MARLEEQYRLVFEELEKVSDLNGLADLLRTLLEPYGLAHAVYHSAKIPGKVIEEPVLVLTYSPAWIERYVGRNYFRIDPVVAAGITGFLPIDWNDLPRHDPEARAFFGEATEFGVGRHGLTLPIHGPDGQHALFSLTSNCTARDWRALKQEYIRDFLVIAHYVHDRAQTLCFPETPKPRGFLTARERDCLGRLARGRSVEQISDELGISVATVRMHLSSARHRLGALNSHHAVAKAVAAGIVA